MNGKREEEEVRGRHSANILFCLFIQVETTTCAMAVHLSKKNNEVPSLVELPRRRCANSTDKETKIQTTYYMDAALHGVGRHSRPASYFPGFELNSAMFRPNFANRPLTLTGLWTSTTRQAAAVLSHLPSGKFAIDSFEESPTQCFDLHQPRQTPSGIQMQVGQSSAVTSHS